MPDTVQDKSEKQIDKELKNTFPASDPPSTNVFVGAPEDSEVADKQNRHEKAEQKSAEDMKQETEKFSPDDAE